MILKERTSKTVRREVYEFNREYGDWEASTWTRRTVDGDLDAWIPHDAYGEMFESDAATGEVKEKLENLYQQSEYSSDVS